MSSISIVIPVKNGEQTLERCLLSIKKQTLSDIEIIILDSNSKDGSREIAVRYGATIIDIPEVDFDHGLTRNEGVKYCKNDLIFFTVQDAWLPDTNMLEKMTSHFSNTKIMGVCGHQAVPHEKDKNPVRWYKPISVSPASIKKVASQEVFDLLTKDEQRNLIAWDDVVAMYRKSALQINPFVQTLFAEDWIWCRQALLIGWQLVYDPSLVIYHYHHLTYNYSFRVSFTVNYHFLKFFNFKPHIPPFIKPMIQSGYHLLKNKQLTVKEKYYWYIHNVTMLAADFLSVVNFLLRLKLGGFIMVEAGYLKYCNSIPQGKQK